MAILFHIDCRERVKFFRRLAPAADAAGEGLIAYTHLPSARLAVARMGRPCIMVSREQRKPMGVAEQVSLRETREIVAGRLSESPARRLARSVEHDLRQAVARRGVASVWSWNGANLFGEVGRAFAAERDLPTLFPEIANLPGKMFADPIGVNARSSLYHDPSQLDRMPADLEAFEAWRAAYLESKRQAHYVPQSRKAMRIAWGPALLDHVGFSLGLAPRFDRRSAWSLLRAEMRAAKAHWPVERIEPAQAKRDLPYVFFPLQVADDTQVLLNSDVGLLEAIRQACREASDLGAELWVKPHPADKDITLRQEVVRLRTELGFRLVDGNTFSLLANARRVIVVNSTAGFEAMLLCVETTFLGRSYFPLLNTPHRQAAYVQRELLDIDYFASDPLTVDQLEALRSRAAVPVSEGVDSEADSADAGSPA